VSEIPLPENDLTLSPIIDLANYTADSEVTCAFGPINRPASSASLSFLSTPNQALKKDDELFLKYGYHSNSVLFSEYGFVMPPEERGVDGEVCVDDILEPMFEKHGEWMKEALNKHDYWGYAERIFFSSIRVSSVHFAGVGRFTLNQVQRILLGVLFRLFDSSIYRIRRRLRPSPYGSKQRWVRGILSTTITNDLSDRHLSAYAIFWRNELQLDWRG
jgi:hypothetical protein